MTGDLAAWLREQIAEDRSVAERNTGEDGLARGYPDYRTYVDDDTRAADAYIECFDPRRMLAQCEAYTAILREHRPYGEWLRDELPDWAPSTERSCIGCGFDNQEERRTSDVNNCPTLRALALAYRHRSGYREEWRPEA